MTYALDANCLVAAVLETHVHHNETVLAIERLEASGATATMLAHALLESYAVLTRLPGADRVDPHTAAAALADSWSDRAIAAVQPSDPWSFLNTASGEGIAGGRVYDALIGHTASDAGIDVLLTWNTRHFERWPMGGTVARTPAEVLAG